MPERPQGGFGAPLMHSNKMRTKMLRAGKSEAVATAAAAGDHQPTQQPSGAPPADAFTSVYASSSLAPASSASSSSVYGTPSIYSSQPSAADSSSVYGTPSSSSSSSKGKCPQCGSKLSKDAGFCGKCGANV